MTVPVLRPATEADVPSILAINAACDTASRWTEAQYLHALIVPADMPVQRAVLVAEHGGQVLGFAVAAAVLALTPCEAELENLAVGPAYRGQGVGAALLRAVLAWAADLDSAVVRLEVRSRNLGAIALYTRIGFRLVGTRRGYYSAPVDDAVCMEYALHSPAEA